MRRYLLVAAAVVVLLAAGVVGRGAWSGADVRAQDRCDWADATADRNAVARQLLYPNERQEQSTGSLQGDAQALYDLAQEQANTNVPEEGFNLSGDLVEAYSAGANALAGGTASAESQIAFAKSIVYNADLRLAYLLEDC